MELVIVLVLLVLLGLVGSAFAGWYLVWIGNDVLDPALIFGKRVPLWKWFVAAPLLVPCILFLLPVLSFVWILKRFGWWPEIKEND